MRFSVPFRLLEINVISAQDLGPVSRSMQTYAVAWVHPDRKLTTRVDQTGHANPSWNEKFVFRVDDNFLNSDSSTLMVEIYSVAWLKKDTRVGNVSVLISNLLPPSVREDKSSDMRYVALQVRRPSGRPQGILNLGVALLDNTFRSMPLYPELGSSREDPNPESGRKPDPRSDDKGSMVMLRRTHSDVTDRTTDPQQKASSVVNHGSMINGGSIVNGGSIINGGSVVNGGSMVGAPKKGGGGSMISDVGPSASVVAAAIAKGIYPIHLGPMNNNNNRDRHNDGGSMILGNWNEKDSGVEGLKTKIARWRTEMPPMYDYQKEMEKDKKRKRDRRRRAKSVGLFSCFGNAYGIEFSITCGGTKTKKRFGNEKVFEDSSEISESFV